ncbi:MAG TPA: FAD-dependent oxidoreductase [Solirubrobacteraceae bacterium]|nr:FAD-dependent oxidoreductase [Solirubrobacteraceae bacterium]
MLAAEYPSYLEMHQRLPVTAWHILRGVTLTAAFALIAVLFAAPPTGLIAWWLFILPCVPLLLMLAPGLWRNVCPMASLNQVPRLLGFSRSLRVPRWLARNAILIQVAFYFALISTRAPVFDHNGRAVGALMLVALGAAFVGGVIFRGKSGWCGTFCPLMPVQRLYGQTPAVVVPNSHCSTCVGCTANCLDFNPRLAVIADVQESSAYRVGQLKVFAGVFPGFVLAFFTVPNSIVGAPAHLGVATGTFYLMAGLYMLVSLGVFALLDLLLPVSALVLMAVFGALALNLHNVLRFTTAFHVAKPVWLRVVEGLFVASITATFVVRTYRHEHRVAALKEASTLGRADVPSDVRRSPADKTSEVRFAPTGPRVVVPTATTLLEAAERAELPVEAGCRMGVCGADPVAVLDGGQRLSPLGADERSTLERLGLSEGCRMACCARVLGQVDVSFDLTSIPTLALPRVEVVYDRTVEHVVVVGNGIAGTTAADHVRRRHPDCSIDLIGEELHPTYNRMGISRLVYGRSAMAGLHLVEAEWYERHGVTAWLNTLATRVDRNQREVVLGTGERLSYDRLILAMGATAFLPPVAGIEQPGVFVMRRADDAMAVRTYAQRHDARRALVIGGGLLGLEVAYALHRFGLRTTVVHRSRSLLRGQLDAHGSELLEHYFVGLGIDLMLGNAPQAILDASPLALRLSDGDTITADVVVVCAGIRPCAGLAAEAGLEVRRGVVVDDHMRTSDPAIFAAGDVAEHRGVTDGLWPVAVAQAEVAAANAVGDSRVYDRQPRRRILKGVGLNVQSAGEVEGEPGDEDIHFQPTGDELRYWKLLVRHGELVGAEVFGTWPEAGPVFDAVAAHAHVQPLLARLRNGDLTPLAVAAPTAEPDALSGDRG